MLNTMARPKPKVIGHLVPEKIFKGISPYMGLNYCSYFGHVTFKLSHIQDVTVYKSSHLYVSNRASIFTVRMSISVQVITCSCQDQIGVIIPHPAVSLSGYHCSGALSA